MAHWVCQVCNQPIGDDEDGGVLVFNTNPQLGEVGGHPVGPTVEPAEPETMVLPSPEAWDFLKARHEAVSIGFSVAHRRCERNSSDGPYFIDTQRALTLESWASWVLHLADKAWMGRDDIVRMLAFWWTHKGQYPPLD